ncbi:5-oxoprolinase subunit PxpB [Arcticibacterium luteifluviistationis]|uniref:Kinase inhibitor n=1 Tax=Arcticibacterium luteifluviistationis TaxID=1784714 RepID=A0A2Z4GGG0_9BACT|nr:5-oxoprolinase subunit PxpB [Arcticibacterium luteifluviistationis]AWW00490.1 kinase inhibitor [Arcticibacterium luteifluviistationis]
MKYEIYSLSEHSISLYFEQKISPEINDLVLSACEWINKNPMIGFVEVVPAYASLTVFYKILEIKPLIKSGTISEYVEDYLKSIPFEELTQLEREPKIVEIPVKYNGEDLISLCEAKEIDRRELIKLHTAPDYRVYMMGFLPGFAYLGGLDKKLSMPRRAKPRIRVPKGSVGIAGNQTGIYPVSSPGGWQLIGQTDAVLFDPKMKKMTLLNNGDTVRFVEG